MEEELSYEDAVKQLCKEVREMIAELAIGSGSKTDAEIDALKATLEKKSSTLKAIEDALLVVNAPEVPSPTTVVAQGVTTSSVVPAGLPLFQWVGRVKDVTKEVFADVEECCGRFGDKLDCYQLNHDLHWYRLLPSCLPGELRSWLNEYVKVSGSDMSWKTVKGAIIGRFGAPKEQLKFERMRKFLRCAKKNEESVDEFIERFKGLRARARISDKSLVTLIFFDAFPKEFASLMMVAMSQAPESSLYDVDYLVLTQDSVMSLARGTHTDDATFLSSKHLLGTFRGNSSALRLGPS